MQRGRRGQGRLARRRVRPVGQRVAEAEHPVGVEPVLHLEQALDDRGLPGGPDLLGPDTSPRKLTSRPAAAHGSSAASTPWPTADTISVSPGTAGPTTSTDQAPSRPETALGTAAAAQRPAHEPHLGSDQRDVQPRGRGASSASTVSSVSSRSSIPFSQTGIGSTGSMCTLSSSVGRIGPT